MHIRPVTRLNGSALAQEQRAITTRSRQHGLAADWGHFEAGEALGATRDESHRMVEQKTTDMTIIDLGPL